MSSQPSVTDRVALVSRVLAAINLDDEPLLAADEIDDVRSDRLLTDEFVTHQGARAQAIPETQLGFC